MNEDALLRRRNLARLCKARHWTAKDLHVRLQGGYSYSRDLLEDPAKSFGEKAARRIEDALDLPRGWLDDDLPVPDQSHRVEQPQQPYRIPRWVFSVELFATVDQLDEDDIRHAENVLRAHLRLPAIEPPAT